MAKQSSYTYSELSAFCFQISTLLDAAVSLEDGLAVMAEDARSEEEKKRLQFMADEISFGAPLYEVMEKTEAFPDYVVRMAKLGFQTGTEEQMMASLAAYYEKEDRMRRTLKNALTYPAMMTVMLLVVLSVLFTKVMPVFSEVYVQLGAELSPLAEQAIRIGGILCFAALIVILVIGIVVLILRLISRSGKKIRIVENLVEGIRNRSSIAGMIAKRRLCAVLGMTLKSGMELERGLELAKELAANRTIVKQIEACEDGLLDGLPYDEVMKASGLFNGFQVQMLRVGNRSGRLDQIMERLALEYEEETDTAIEGMISRLEPTIVAVLAVVVGMVLLSVMLPLVGVLSAIG